MDSSKNELLEKIKSSSNVLITVNKNPSIDQLAAGIGLSLILNKMDKHATTVFSGEVPKNLDFLEPEKNIETTTDSLRDFIISLDKEKADKLKYKVEDGQVKIFITPYKTSISEEDLNFSQGDFNVDLVILLGALSREELDQAIISHGRILHDAVIATIGTNGQNTLGSINYSSNASSISEIVAELADSFGKEMIDNQIANAFLTGIVAETDRFSNDKTTSNTLAVSSRLVAAGANQQLVAMKLSEEEVVPTLDEPEEQKDDDGNLVIEHTGEENYSNQEDNAMPEKPESYEPSLAEIEEANKLGKLSELELPTVNEENNPVNSEKETKTNNKYIEESDNAPSPITANQKEEELEPALDILSGSLSSEFPESSSSTPTAPAKNENLPETETPTTTDDTIDNARQAVDEALMESPQPIKPIQSLNAQPVIEIDHGEINEDHEIMVDDNGQILVSAPAVMPSPTSELKPDPVTDDKLPYETTIQPLHDLKKNILDEETSNSTNSPPPVPPPIPM